MKKLNLLSRSEMKMIFGGIVAVEPVGKECKQATCKFEQAGVGETGGWCGLAMNGTQCRCINETASVPFEDCKA